MKVILQENVSKLGTAGDIVEASRGYYRNFLEPRGLAVVASKGTLKKREEDLDALKRKAEKAHQEAVNLGEKIAKLPSLRVETKAGETGKLYGKVTNKEIAAQIEAAIGVSIDKRTVKPLEEITALGTYKVQVKLTADVIVECEIDVVIEGTPVRDLPPPDAPEEIAEEIAEEKAEELEVETATG
ncbi:MAG: 50S ribosomal protein L9, partial [Candidatus Obscuribacterales bacterium]|nr:50S ribosomal protein L9 [Candidatus Obscuribacterales bacterium]